MTTVDVTAEQRVCSNFAEEPKEALRKRIGR